MKKRTLQIIAVAIILVLVCASVFILWNESKNKVTKSNAGIIEPIEPAVIIDTLEVTYWNPWGGPVSSDGNIVAHKNIDYPLLPFSYYIKESDIVVSVTVTESIRWTKETEEGQKKIRELGSPWAYPYGKECYLDVNDVLKGNFEINQIYLKTDMENPNFAVGEEYILFINTSKSINSNCRIMETNGFLIKKDSNYEGIEKGLSISINELKDLLNFSD